MQHETEIDKFYAQVDGHRHVHDGDAAPDGHLRSRAMANQRRAAGADLWFVTAEGSAKLATSAHDPHINLSYYRDQQGMGQRVGNRDELARSRRSSANSTRPTGRSGSPRKAIRVMARQTIRAWCWSASRSMRPSSSK